MFDLSPFNIQVTQGEELAIALHVSSGVPFIGWLGQTDNPYPNGSSFERVIGNHEWTGDANGADLGFQDFVNPGVAAVPEPSSFLLLASAGVGLLGYGWRRRKEFMVRMKSQATGEPVY